MWFQKISILPPHKIIGNFEGEGGRGGSKAVISEEWGGSWETTFPKGDEPRTKH